MRVSRPSVGRFRTAALLLVLVAAAGWLAVRGLGPPSERSPVIRPIIGETVAAGGPLLLAWEGGGPPFRVTLSDPGGTVVWRSERLPQPLVAVPGRVRVGLRIGVEYHWKVTGVDRRGGSIESAPFRLRLEGDVEPLL